MCQLYPFVCMYVYIYTYTYIYTFDHERNPLYHIVDPLSNHYLLVAIRYYVFIKEQ